MSLLVLFFFLMLFTPLVYQGPRSILLGIILIRSIGGKKPIIINKEVAFYWLITFISSLFAFINGAARGNPEVFYSLGLNLGWPLLFLYFMMRCDSIDTIISLLKTIVYGGFIVAIFNFIMILNNLVLHIGVLDVIGGSLNMMFNISEGFAEYFSPSGNHLPYILFFCVTLLLLNPDAINVKKKYIIACIVLSLIDILLSNRRAMWIVVLMLPFVLLLLFSLLPYNKGILKKIVVTLFIAAAILIATVFVFLDVEYLTKEFMSSFDFSGEETSNLERTLQGQSLWKDFIDEPIIGKGFGHVSKYVRSGSTYELTYNAMLVNLGLVGFVIRLMAIVWTYIKSLKLSRKNIEYASILAPQIMGLFALLIISATNPYIGTFDFVWTVFLPVVTINTLWREKLKNVKK